MQKVRAEIHLGNIRRNAEKFAALYGNALCAVVKANAYGHGAEEVVNALSGVADFFAVALFDEALAIRAVAGEQDILVFTPPVTEEEAYALAVNGFTVSIPDLWTAKLLLSVCKKYRLSVKVHLKVNTGMNRYGMNASMLGKVCRLFSCSPYICVTGLYSHLYTTNLEIALQQRDLFLRMQRICRVYFPEVISHLSATYGALLGKDFAFDMLRIGLGLYGYLPIKSGLILEKGMTVKARVMKSQLPSFGGLGYGETVSAEFLKGLGKTHLCRFGYADGFLRVRQNGAEGGENLNRLCMDACIRKGEKRRGQEIAILTDADTVAMATGTIAYEVLCAATRRAEFIYDYE